MTNTESPWNEGEISVTLKQSKDYAAPWIVAKGPDAASVKKQVEEITGLSGEGLTLHELVYNAAYSFQKISTVATGLDGVVIPDEEKPQKAAVGHVQVKVEPESTEEENVAPAAPAPSPEPDLKATVAGLTSKKELTDVYLKNKAAFDGDEALMAALQARFTAEDVT